jgi:two-component system sensor histidine kinase AlgZ
MNRTNIKQKWQAYLAIVFTTSRSYKIVTSLVFLFKFLFTSYIWQGFATNDIPYAAIAVRAVLDTALLFAVAHFFVRTYLKILILGEPLSWRKSLSFLAFLIPVAALTVAVSFGIGQIEMLKFSDVNSLQLTNNEGALQFKLSKLNFFLIALINTHVLFVVWSIIYLFWHQQQNRKKMQQEMHQAQIQQLTNQLNPHFLFNAFNSIRALIYEDRDKAADTVTQLSELFRIHLQAHLKAKSTLEEEWQVSSRYLAIEGIRLEERLQLKVDIDQQLSAQHLPTLTLLMLVENAVKHGITPNSEHGLINLKASKIDDKRWQLSVGNSVNKNSKAAGTQTGLKNIKQRMELMFGQQYAWQQLKTDNYFEVKMELPLA